MSFHFDKIYNPNKRSYPTFKEIQKIKIIPYNSMWKIIHVYEAKLNIFYREIEEEIKKNT